MHPAELHRRVSSAYRDAESPPPARQIVLLLDRAIRHLGEARQAIQECRIEARYQHVVKAHAIVAALQSCLDFERGGEIARTLDRLYNHTLGRLMLINLRNDPAICEELRQLLDRMRTGWAAIDAGEPAETAPAPRLDPRAVPVCA
ncbi:MAG: flagellar export chaperone FliS [Geminicoccaceae bacterium]